MQPQLTINRSPYKKIVRRATCLRRTIAGIKKEIRKRDIPCFKSTECIVKDSNIVYEEISSIQYNMQAHDTCMNILDRSYNRLKGTYMLLWHIKTFMSSQDIEKAIRMVMSLQHLTLKLEKSIWQYRKENS